MTSIQYLQPLFDTLHDMGIIALESEMQEMIRVVNNLNKTKMIKQRIKADNQTKYNLAVQMFAKGLTQKAIAEKVGVSEKTATAWLRPVRNIDRLKRETLEQMYIRLNKMAVDPHTSAETMLEMIQAIELLEKHGQAK